MTMADAPEVPADARGRSVSVVVPIAQANPVAVRAALSYMDVLRALDLEHEVLVVTDARHAADGVAAELEREAAIRLLPVDGWRWGRAVTHGLAQARGDLLCYVDPAPDSADMLRLMLVYALTFPDVVVKPHRRTRGSIAHRLGALLYNLECRALFDLVDWDVNGTPKVFPRTCRALLALTREDELVDVEFAIKCRREGYPLLEVPVSGVLHRSRTSLRTALKMYVGVYRLRRGLGPPDLPASGRHGRG